MTNLDDYTEDTLVEKPTVDLFKSLGYTHQYCYDEKFGENATLGRETKSEVILTDKLKQAIINLNDDINPDEIKKTIEELTKDRSRLSIVNANKEIYKLIKNGVKVKTKNKKGETETKTVKIIDFDKPENNDFFLASQFWITGEIYPRRPDLIGFVNGIPLIFIELKANHRRLKDAYNDNLSDYKDTIPQIFWYNAFIILSNGRQAKIGTITSEYEHFSDWKKIRNENEPEKISLETLIRGTCEQNRFIDLLENFTLFTSIKGKPVKILAKNHQYLGVNNAIESFNKIKQNQGRLGVFWHTQGAGKSFSMIFFSQKILRKFKGNYTFVVVTDRDALDTQIYENFEKAGVITEKQVQAQNGEHLKQLLREDHRHVFTLIQKFQTKNKGEKYPKLSDRDDIIIMTDEAHRTQYDTLALNMRNALPNAAFIGFTGTPLMKKGEEKTRETFGDYVSIYNFRDSIIDNSTVPLYYENRVPELQLINPDLNEDIYDAIDKADLDEKQEEKLSREFSKEYQLLTREERLDTISKDIIHHFINRGYKGKAMVVSIDKITTVKMYEKVQQYLKQEIKQIEQEQSNASYEETIVLQDKINKLKNIDMAVVVSPEQNEIKKFREQGLDIKKHRIRMNKEDLEEKFKDSDDNFQIVFVCSMWMTGFDVPCLSTIYLDKPMKNHTLMQAISRANRVFAEKLGGFIVDYVNIFKNLRKALALYAAPRTGRVDYPIESKEELVKKLREYIQKINEFLKNLTADTQKIINSKGFEKIAELKNANDAILKSEETKKKFLSDAGNAIKIYKAILPHKNASEFSPYISLYKELIKEIRSLDPEVDISGVLQDIEKILDESIATKGYIIKEVKDKKIIDISKIDFEKLREKFEEQRNKHTEFERLKNILSYQLKEMIMLNKTRIDYQERLETIIKEYNAGSKNIEKLFEELLQFAKEIKQEDTRAIRENLTEEELALFDILRKPNLSEKETKQLKKAARELLETLKKEKLVLDWRKKQQTRACVRLRIQRYLSEHLPRSYDDLTFKQKCSIVFQHIYDNYKGDGESTYEMINHQS
jgi:type I restriction enzyme, R subunit